MKRRQLLTDNLCDKRILINQLTDITLEKHSLIFIVGMLIDILVYSRTCLSKP